MDVSQILLSFLVMSLLSIIIVSVVIFIDRVLCNYGDCALTVIDGEIENEYVTNGGSNLLAILTSHDFEISSACGGKGVCGYCKVLVPNGGGDILPTEEVFLTFREEQENMRMACQIKIRKDITVVIPDYFDIVKNMVLHNKFDSKKRWRWTVQ